MIPPQGKPTILLAKPAPGYHAWPIADDFCRHLYRCPAATFPALAGAVPREGVAFYDGVFEPGATPEALGRLAADFPIVALGVVSPVTALNTHMQIRAIRQLAPRTKIIMGGHHATMFAERWLEHGVDAVVRQEGEQAFAELTQRYLAGESPAGIAGVTWRDGERTVVEADREFVHSLDDLPLPRWDVVDFSLYDLGMAPHGRSASLETARGCGHGCTFCCVSTMWRRRQRFKSAARVAEELRDLHARGVRQLLIADDNFGAHRERDKEIFEQTKNLDMAMWALIRPETIYRYPDWVDAAAAGGLKMALVGFENLDQRMLQDFDKDVGLGLPEYREVYRRLRAHGVFVYGLFVRDYDFTDHDVWPYRGLFQVADMTTHCRYIPMPGVPAADTLIQEGYEMRDMFYHNRFIPAFRHHTRIQKSRFAGAALLALIHPRNFWKMWRGDYVARTFFRRVYGGILKDLLNMRWKHMKILSVWLHRNWSPQKRQDATVRLALDDKP
ncbi:MAG: radical SAM protein [Candidatus Lernaella stagnicola]|nr:radical SAM protein [Candidatus Lernaella stagnicola]